MRTVTLKMSVSEDIVRIVEQACESKVSADEIRDSPVADFGCSVAFRLAKERGKSPKDVARELADKIKPVGLIDRVEAVNGYLNFHLNYAEFTRKVLEEIRQPGAEYGRGERKKEKIILEHTSVNPTGPVHVGRLRNTIIGDSLRRILGFGGYEVETHYYVNDIGKQVAIIALGLKQIINPDEDAIREYAKYKDREDFQIFFTYVMANRMFEEDSDFQSSVQELIQHAEAEDLSSLEDITSAARRCLEGQRKTFERLGVKFDFFDFESDDLRMGDVGDILEKLEKSEYAREGEIGFGLDLSSFGIVKQGGLSVLRRKDGTSVYLSRDIAYHVKKAGLGDKLINVLGEDHKLEAVEVKIILEKILGVKTPIEIVHFSFVSFEGEKFSTRRGKIAAAEVLLDEAVEKAGEEIKKRGIADESIAPIIGVGAVKFGIIKIAPTKPITFKWAEALNFEGETAPYIQYAHARSCRILEKAGVSVESIRPDEISLNLENDEERRLVKALAEFPQRVDEAVCTLRPDIIATYLLKLTSAYGGFYMKCPVLDAEDKVKKRRLLLVNATKNTIKKGLELLGIESPERM